MIAKRLLAIQKASSPPAPAATDVYYDYRSLILNMQGSAGSTTFTDSSPNNFTVTPYGNAQLATVPGESVAFLTAASFDGNGDYLQTDAASCFAGTQDFTVEFWLYWDAVPTADTAIIGALSSGGSSIGVYNYGNSFGILKTGGLTFANFGSKSQLTAGQWNHVAVTRSGSSHRCFINGMLSSSGVVTLSADWGTPTTCWIGRQGGTTAPNYLAGKIGPTRISPWAVYKSNFTPSANLFPAIQGVPAQDPYYDKNSLILNMQGSSSSTVFVDESPNAFALTPYGNAQLVSDATYGTVASFDGAGDYLLTSTNSILDFGTGDFTVEAWINLPNTSSTKGIISGTSTGSFGFRVGQSYNNNPQALSIYRSGAADCEYCLYNFSINTYHHVAVCRISNVVSFYVNGIKQTTLGSGGATNSFPNPVAVKVGGTNGTVEQFSGLIGPLRITKGVARYTSNFTPPTGLFPEIYNPYTTLPVPGAALWLDGADSSTLFTDAGVTPVNKSGDLVYQWSDKSGNNRHATQATSANRPTWVPPASGQNGFGAVRVQTGRRLSLSTTYTLTSDFTCFVVMKNASSLIVWLDSNSSTSVNSVAKTPLYYSGWGGGGGWTSSLKSGNQPTLNSASPFSGPSMLMFSRAGTSGTFSIDSAIYSATYSTSAVEIDHAVGGIQNNISTDFSVFEQIVYPSALNAAEINSVKSYLRTKWETP